MSDDDDNERGAFARNEDPLSSHIAADLVDFPKLESIVLACLRDKGPQSQCEVAVATGIRDGSITPRFKRLEAKGLIVRQIDEHGCIIHRKSLYSNRPVEVWALKYGPLLWSQKEDLKELDLWDLKILGLEGENDQPTDTHEK